MTEGLFSVDELEQKNNSESSEVKITEVKQTKNGPNERKEAPVVKEVVPDEVNFVFTCKKCGCHDFTNMSTNMSKWGGAGVGANKIKVCKNCNFAESDSTQ